MRLYHPLPFKLTPVAEACAAYCWWLGREAETERRQSRFTATQTATVKQ